MFFHIFATHIKDQIPVNNISILINSDAVAEALGDDGRILVRESGTEPVIRVMVEAATDELCEKYVTQVIDVIEKEGLIVE